MNYAIVDIGSNSMRLTVFDVADGRFRILFKERLMAGLAGYVENGRLSADGIDCACAGLQKFRDTLDALGIETVSVIATASLRNIENTAEAVEALRRVTGYSVEVLSGEQEALAGYRGALCDWEGQDGVFTDIGGASTEIVLFSDGEVRFSHSFPVGSLKLYRDCVQGILPDRKALDAMQRTLRQVVTLPSPAPQRTLLCVGGTARAVLRVCQKLFDLPADTRTIPTEQLDALYDRLTRSPDKAAKLLLRLTPERIHTFLPGLCILRHIVTLFGAEEITVSRYGVREGYLCQKIHL